MLEKITTFLAEVRAEFGRVNWPTREDLVNSTSVVLVFSLVFAVFIGLFDLIISYIRAVLIDL